MAKTISGRIRGRTIELTEDPGLQDGQEVRVQVTPLPPAAPWGEGLRRCAGVLADDSEWDGILEAIYQDRKRDTRRDIPTLVMSVAQALAVANGAAVAHGTEPADSLVSIAEESSATGRVWRIHYGPRDYVGRRGGDLTVLVDDRGQTVQRVIRWQ